MKIGLRILLGYFVIVALAAWLLGNVFVQQVKPGVRQAMEDTLADTANVLAELATDDFLAGHIDDGRFAARVRGLARSEEHTSELQSLMRISYAVFCLKKKKQYKKQRNLRPSIMSYTTTLCHLSPYIN